MTIFLPSVLLLSLLPSLLPALLPSPFSLATTQQAPPPLTQPVNDFANVIDGGSEQELDRMIRALQQATGDVIVVATVPTFQPYATIDEYAVKMFENHGKGIGTRKNDNGLLMVVAVNDRKVRIEVGYELEAFITDGFAGQTIREVIAPAFRAGQYGPGLVAATRRIVTRIAEGRGVTLTDLPQPAVPDRASRRSGGGFPVVLVVFILFLILRVVAGRTNRRRRRYWGGGPWSGWNSGVGPFGGGGFGGGFGGFGGGGGGGAAGGSAGLAAVGAAAAGHRGGGRDGQGRMHKAQGRRKEGWWKREGRRRKVEDGGGGRQKVEDGRWKVEEGR